MPIPRRTDGDLPDDLSYEDFDDIPLIDDEDAVDLDALDAEISESDAPEPPKPAAPKAAPGPLRLPLEPPQRVRPAGRTPSRPASSLSRSRSDAGPAPRPSQPASLPTPLPLPFDDRAESPAAPAPPVPQHSASQVESPSPDQTPGPAAPEAGTTAQAASAEISPALSAQADDQVPSAQGDIALVQAQPSPEPEPPPVDWVYHVLLGLPEDLSVLVLELRSTGEVIDMPPPGLPLVGSFRSDVLQDVEQALTAWRERYLPLELELTGVLAEVVGSQQYVAAWTLQPEDELREAQRALCEALDPLIALLPDSAPEHFRARLSIGDHVPARRYPHLIGHMQRDFEPATWRATHVLLVRKDAEADAGAWEIVRRLE